MATTATVRSRKSYSPIRPAEAQAVSARASRTSSEARAARVIGRGPVSGWENGAELAHAALYTRGPRDAPRKCPRDGRSFAGGRSGLTRERRRPQPVEQLLESDQPDVLVARRPAYQVVAHLAAVEDHAEPGLPAEPIAALPQRRLDRGERVFADRLLLPVADPVA